MKRKDGIIVLMDEQHIPHNLWTFKRGFPVKFEGPTMKGAGNEVAIESLEIAHEGLWQLSILKLGAGCGRGGDLSCMDVQIDELHTTVDAVDGDALLTPDTSSIGSWRPSCARLDGPAAVAAAARGTTSTRARSSSSNAAGSGR